MSFQTSLYIAQTSLAVFPVRPNTHFYTVYRSDVLIGNVAGIYAIKYDPQPLTSLLNASICS